jgi:hypothetical protein
MFEVEDYCEFGLTLFCACGWCLEMESRVAHVIPHLLSAISKTWRQTLTHNLTDNIIITLRSRLCRTKARVSTTPNRERAAYGAKHGRSNVTKRSPFATIAQDTNYPVNILESLKARDREM